MLDKQHVMGAAAEASEPALVLTDQAPTGLGATRFDQAQEDCAHLATITSCGIKVCMDCGQPMNARARAIAGMRRS